MKLTELSLFGEGLDLGTLNEPQREAVLHGEGPLLILAGAGSGKTRVITYRIANLLRQGVPPWGILAVTFTNKAAGEMRDRVFELTQGRGAGVWISTFHSMCAQFLRTEGRHYGVDRDYAIYDDDDQKKVIKECLRELNLDEKQIKPGLLASRISREKDQLMDPESFSISAAASGDPAKEMLSSVYALYQQKLQKAHAFDFGDLIMKTAELLRNHDALREKYQERFRHVLVDEYQDTNRAQYVLTKTLAAKHKNLCVVGDDDQAIYSWRGADIRNILDFEKDYSSVKVIRLEENYRSTQPILTAAWNLVQNNRQRKEKKLWTQRESQTPVEAEQLQNEIEEAHWIAGKIAELNEESALQLSQIAVFYRTNAQSRVLEDAFRQAQLPYVLIGSMRFYERAEVKDVLAYLKVVVNPNDDLSLKRIINCPPRGVGKTTLEGIEKFAADRGATLFQALGSEELRAALPSRARQSLGDFRKMLDAWIARKDQMTVSVLVKDVLQRTEMLNLLKEEAKTDPEAAARLDNVQELMNATEEFEEKSEQKTPSSYLEQVSLSADIDKLNDKKNGVTLMTVHIAKGLEFSTVFLTGLEEGLFPLGEAQFSQEDLEEERRLAYVGMTRAKNRLFLTCAASRRLFGQTHWNTPSRFIQEAGILGSTPARPEPAFTASERPPEPKGRVDDSRLRVGDRVRHAQFGYGKISEKSGSGDDLKVVVHFDEGSWKKFLVKYANLERMK